ncbi:MAG: gliding motility protein GldL, partial [Saprospiraceae bacterium]|nr:gliding motility protein GldL [Saprospiraceae bacterium]
QKGGMRPLNADAVENQLGGMLTELQAMAKSLGSLKALQEVDFSQTNDQMKAMNSFYSQMTDAMSSLTASVEDTKQYQAQMASLSKNLTSLNAVYGNILSAYNVKG